jgi:uncharacterized protein YecT (DUF1311 family)
MVVSLMSCVDAAAGDSPCSVPETTLAVAQCSAEKLKKLEGDLDSVYQQALGKLPEVNNQDNRKTKDQLRKAQGAWRIYRDENCLYVGGLEGGNSMWVTEFSNECALVETEKRIDFFRHLPVGG